MACTVGCDGTVFLGFTTSQSAMYLMTFSRVPPLTVCYLAQTLMSPHRINCNNFSDYCLNTVKCGVAKQIISYLAW